MVVNGRVLLEKAPIKDMLVNKVKGHGVSHGLGEAGYDICIKQNIIFKPEVIHFSDTMVRNAFHSINGEKAPGRFCIASAIEEFDMPDDLVGIVHDKSTWARKGLSVFNTVIEPGWKGFLTLELIYHGQEELHIPAGAGIAQVVFHALTTPTSYVGKYQHQPDEPVAAKLA